MPPILPPADTMARYQEEPQPVLRLVHPGRYVETHRHPVLASEVMTKNPRHFVTRPDVFRFPWIVVRPESLLKPGNVFYIVPFRTLYSLLRASQSHSFPAPANPRRSKRLRPPPIDPWHADAVVYSNIGVLGHSTDGGTEGAEAGGRGLKSCLKKGAIESAKQADRRVAFALPNDDGDDEAGLEGFMRTASNFFDSLRSNTESLIT